MVLQYDVLLFDLDNTLFDFNEAEKNAFTNSFTSIELPNGFKDYHESYKAISNILWDDLEKGHVSLNDLKVERFKRLFIEHQLTIDAEQFGQTYLNFLGEEVHIFEGVEEMINRVANHRLVVLTNGFKDVQHARIADSPLSKSFEEVITSEETGYQKPQREIFEYTFDKLKLTDKSRVLMIGDSLSSDIQGGNNFGIDTCWFNPDRLENNSPIKPTYEIQNWNDFLVKESVVVKS